MTSAQVFAHADGGTRFVWISDFLPHDISPQINEVMEHGIGAVKKTLESRPTPATRR
jgi:hypothetical protein